ncbi:MAG: nitronate monooxygenase, partial [Gammaproteobacteria bacterium]|nr:nitronate monooxygenase [Gammaproteobacteria bacterium]
MLELLGIELPIIQAPMAGVGTPAMAAAVGTAGALGSLGLGASDLASARAMIEDFRR